jgi:hypothetical protein
MRNPNTPMLVSATALAIAGPGRSGSTAAGWQFHADRCDLVDTVRRYGQRLRGRILDLRREPGNLPLESHGAFCSDSFRGLIVNRAQALAQCNPKL